MQCGVDANEAPPATDCAASYRQVDGEINSRFSRLVRNKLPVANAVPRWWMLRCGTTNNSAISLDFLHSLYGEVGRPPDVWEEHIATIFRIAK
jgi:hypothetical protein